MKLFIYILILLLSVVQTANAQLISDNNLSRAEFYFQKNELDSAKKYINLVVREEAYINNPKAWFYKGLIYKEQYKLKEKQNLVSELRNEATNAIFKFYTLADNDEFKPQVEVLVKYISATYYNDAARALANSDLETAKTNFNYYKELTKVANLSKATVQDNEIQFKFAFATAIMKINEATALDSSQKETLKTIYNEILAIDSNNAQANYNLSLLYYNEGVDISNNIDYDADFETLLKTQDKIADLFAKALPYMLKAYYANYKKEDVLEGLKSIYTGLNNEEKSVYYENELKSIKK